MAKDYREYQRELNDLKKRIDETYSAMGIDARKKRLELLEKETMDDGFWQDRDKSAVISQEISHIKKKVEQWDALLKKADESVELFDLAMSEDDTELLKDVSSMIEPVRSEFGRLETLELLSEEDDHRNSFLTIHPGAGGTESQDWASILFRMYSRWAEKKSFDVEVIDYTTGEEAGIKSATMLVKGEYSYGLLKCERGIHRLVRISPFDSNKRRHTSFASVEVMPELPDDIDLEIIDSDLKIDTYRASGAGGQHVNTTDSAVRITHIPTGIVVQCQNERSQHKNRASALKLLKSRLYTLRKKENEEKKLEKAGQKSDISWGNQIRSYVLQPYTLIKDHRTEEETGNVEAVLENGNIDRFIYSYLSSLKIKT